MEKEAKLYSNHDTRRLREQFWTTFGKYMRAVPSADGVPVRWTNYKSGIKHLYFRMDVDSKGAYIGITIAHPEPAIRSLLYAQFVELKHVFMDIVGSDWHWDEHTEREGRTVASIHATLENVSIFNKADWPALISFFKPRIQSLDEFWSLSNHHFEVFK